MTEFRKRYPVRLFLPLHQRTLAAFAVALFVGVSLAATGATPQAKPGAKMASAAANPAIAECYKRSGGSYNPVTKRGTIYMSEFDMTVRSDTLRQCIGRAKGVSPGSIKMHEYCLRPPCD